MILVTGGTGLVGSHLLAKLSRNQETILAIYRTEESIQKTKRVFEALQIPNNFKFIQWHQADLLDYFALESVVKGAKYIYHAGAKVSFAAKDEFELMEVNIEGTKNLVNLSLEHNIEKFCYVSSVSSLGEYADGRCTDEEATWQMTNKTSNYSISKYYAENEVWRASQEGLKVVIVNPSTIIGFGNWGESSSKIIKTVKEGLLFYPSGSNGFVGVDTVVEAMTLLMKADISEERFIINSENLSFYELTNLIAKEFNQKGPKYFLPKFWAGLFLFLAKLKAFIFRKNSIYSKESLQTAYKKQCYSNEKVKAAISLPAESMSMAISKACKLYKAII